MLLHFCVVFFIVLDVFYIFSDYLYFPQVINRILLVI